MLSRTSLTTASRVGANSVVSGSAADTRNVFNHTYKATPEPKRTLSKTAPPEPTESESALSSSAVSTSYSTVYYAFDLRGNTTNRVGENGAIQTHSSYNAYGARGSDFYDADPYDGFGGQYGYRKETGAAWLYLCGQRYYSPDEARWLNRDPLGYAGGVNLYSYCGNNPVNRVDPLGLFGEAFPDPFDDSPSQDKYYTSNLVGRGSGIPAANAFLRFESSFIPGASQLLGFHEAITGCDLTGTPVSGLDRALGALPLLPVVGAGRRQGCGQAAIENAIRLGKMHTQNRQISPSRQDPMTTVGELVRILREARPETLS